MIDVLSYISLADVILCFFLCSVRLPDLALTGAHCVSFHYHMYGFHINTLQLLKKNKRNTEQLWERSGQQGNFWLHETVDVKLNEDDQVSFVPFLCRINLFYYQVLVFFCFFHNNMQIIYAYL